MTAMRETEWGTSTGSSSFSFRKMQQRLLTARMSYHRNQNIGGEMLAVDLNVKMMEGVESERIKNLPCKTWRTTECDFYGMYRDRCIGYRYEEIFDKQGYIGSTQNTLKKITRGHASRMRNTGGRYRVWETCMAWKLQNFHNPSNKVMLSSMVIDKLYQGNPIFCGPTFGTASRSMLCAQEKLSIFKQMSQDKHHTLNRRTEITQICMDKPHFHRFKSKGTRDPADESSQEPIKISNHTGSADCLASFGGTALNETKLHPNGGIGNLEVMRFKEAGGTRSSLARSWP